MQITRPESAAPLTRGLVIGSMAPPGRAGSHWYRRLSVVEQRCGRARQLRAGKQANRGGVSRHFKAEA
jgi:hypothetical protein